jgi:pimeloyl-ACP methyl ester carboxylesterase
MNGGKTFVLIHGGGHGAWAFGKLRPYLVRAGHSVAAPDLPGHGLNASFPGSFWSRR